MKNTLIPLSVAFVDEKGKIVSISDMQPQTETSHCAAAPAKFALEMPAGWFAKKGIKSGTTIQGLEKARPRASRRVIVHEKAGWRIPAGFYPVELSSRSIERYALPPP